LVRIVAGRWRGRKLEVPAGLAVRPTADRVKVCIFDTVQAIVPGSRVLDLYAGSGNLGLEALSRGARRAVLVERAPVALRALERNVARLAAGPEVEVVRGDALGYLASSPPEPFDLVLADPPYAVGVEDAVLERAAGVLRAGGWFVLQHGRAWKAPAPSGGLVPWRSKRFGDTVVDFLVREVEARADDGSPRTVSGDL
jgi:16S rRNA (guanine966-N2)-methyltransferase